MAKQCLMCTKEIKGFPSVVKRKNYCSIECSHEALKKRIIKKCLTCGIEIEVAIGLSDRKKFCSKDCYNISMTGRPLHHVKKGWTNDTSFKQGNKHPNWKGGKRKRIAMVGYYILILVPSHPFCDKMGYVLEHRLIMERQLGRFLKPEEVVHHKNEIKKDNRIENLELFSDGGEHTKFHNFLKKSQQ